jgi:hypothetical protein
LYALTVHSSCSIEAPRSSLIVVSAVDTTIASSAAINEATAASTRTHVVDLELVCVLRVGTFLLGLAVRR